MVLVLVVPRAKSKAVAAIGDVGESCRYMYLAVGRYDESDYRRGNE